jgi:hypothetical protein
MDFMHVSGEEVRAAQMLTGATFTAFVLVGFVPGLHAQAGRVRLGITALYLAAVVGFMIYLLVR